MALPPYELPGNRDHRERVASAEPHEPWQWCHGRATPSLTWFASGSEAPEGHSTRHPGLRMMKNYLRRPAVSCPKGTGFSGPHRRALKYRLRGFASRPLDGSSLRYLIIASRGRLALALLPGISMPGVPRALGHRPDRETGAIRPPDGSR